MLRSLRDLWRESEDQGPHSVAGATSTISAQVDQQKYTQPDGSTQSVLTFSDHLSGPVNGQLRHAELRYMKAPPTPRQAAPSR